MCSTAARSPSRASPMRCPARISSGLTSVWRSELFPAAIDPQAARNVALPRSFAAGYGDGVSHGLCLGGGGLFFVAWQIAYLHKLASEGFSVNAADKVVGTSAGSFVGSALTGGRLGRIHTEMSVLGKVSGVFP